MSSCSSLKNMFKTPEKLPPLKTNDKIKAFSLATYYIDEKKFDIEEFNYSLGTIKTNWLQWNTGILGTTTLRSKLVFSLSQENDLDIDFQNIQMDNVKTSPDGLSTQHYWQNASTFAIDYIPIRNSIITYLDSLSSDSVSMKICMDKFLGNFQYNYVVLKTLTEVGRSRFIQQYFLNRNYQWDLPLVDFQYNKNENYKKKYVALFRYNLDSKNEFDKLFSNKIYLNIYTDNDSLANYTKNQLVKYSGTLVNADESFASENFNFDFYNTTVK